MNTIFWIWMNEWKWCATVTQHVCSISILLHTWKRQTYFHNNIIYIHASLFAKKKTDVTSGLEGNHFCVALSNFGAMIFKKEDEDLLTPLPTPTMPAPAWWWKAVTWWLMSDDSSSTAMDRILSIVMVESSLYCL